MQTNRTQPVSGHLSIVERKRGPVFYAKYRDAEGQHQRLLGEAWIERRGGEWRNRRGEVPLGSLRFRDAQERLDEILVDARNERERVRAVGITVGQAIDEWLAYGRRERAWKPSTIRDYESAVKHLKTEFGTLPLRRLTATGIEAWRSNWLSEHEHDRQAAKLVAILYGVCERARRRHGLAVNPVAAVERAKVRYDPASFPVLSVEEVWALVRAAASDQDGCLYLTAAFAGLRRGELVGLRWRDVDFELRAIRIERSISNGEVVVPKSGKARSVPLAPELSQVLAKLSQRDEWTEPDDLVFPGQFGVEFLDPSALRRRFITALGNAKVRRIRFHDLRHTFATRVLSGPASLVQLQHWLGHADLQTTAKYLHHSDQSTDADLLATAFATAVPVAA